MSSSPRKRSGCSWAALGSGTSMITRATKGVHQATRRITSASVAGQIWQHCANRHQSLERSPMDVNEAVIAGYVRTPIGRYGGALASVRPDTLLAHAIRTLLERTNVGPADVDDVIA